MFNMCTLWETLRWAFIFFISVLSEFSQWANNKKKKYLEIMVLNVQAKAYRQKFIKFLFFSSSGKKHFSHLYLTVGEKYFHLLLPAVIFIQGS